MPYAAQLNEQIEELQLQLRAERSNTKSLSREIRRLQTVNRKLVANLQRARSGR